MYSNCLEITQGDTDGCPLSRDISDVEIEVCANEKVMSFVYSPCTYKYYYMGIIRSK